MFGMQLLIGAAESKNFNHGKRERCAMEAPIGATRRKSTEGLFPITPLGNFIMWNFEMEMKISFPDREL